MGGPTEVEEVVPDSQNGPVEMGSSGNKILFQTTTVHASVKERSNDDNMDMDGGNDFFQQDNGMGGIPTGQTS
ncbi:hypothetical protein E2542_SST04313 [Spatholobus suberectus]|nr:hypothetical protein E2542_SST04313 [Spatholobus suberectus]